MYIVIDFIFCMMILFLVNIGKGFVGVENFQPLQEVFEVWFKRLEAFSIY
jgi:hypothetical protein